MKIESLKKFCIDYPEWASEPFNQVGFCYATDGHVIIRTVAIDGLKEQSVMAVEELSWITLNNKIKFRLRPERLSQVRENFLCEDCDPAAPMGMKCDQCENGQRNGYDCFACDGTGVRRQPGRPWNASQCPSCGGSRWRASVVWCMRPSKNIDSRYDLNPRILQALVDEFGVLEFMKPPKTAKPYPPIGFRFDGGDGLLMPMRSADWNVTANKEED